MSMQKLSMGAKRNSDGILLIRLQEARFAAGLASLSCNRRLFVTGSLLGSPLMSPNPSVGPSTRHQVPTLSSENIVCRIILEGT